MRRTRINPAHINYDTYTYDQFKRLPESDRKAIANYCYDQGIINFMNCTAAILIDYYPSYVTRKYKGKSIDCPNAHKLISYLERSHELLPFSIGGCPEGYVNPRHKNEYEQLDRLKRGEKVDAKLLEFIEKHVKCIHLKKYNIEHLYAQYMSQDKIDAYEGDRKPYIRLRVDQFNYKNMKYSEIPTDCHKYIVDNYKPTELHHTVMNLFSKNEIEDSFKKLTKLDKNHISYLQTRKSDRIEELVGHLPFQPKLSGYYRTNDSIIYDGFMNHVNVLPHELMRISDSIPVRYFDCEYGSRYLNLKSDEELIKYLNTCKPNIYVIRHCRTRNIKLDSVYLKSEAELVKILKARNDPTIDALISYFN